VIRGQNDLIKSRSSCIAPLFHARETIAAPMQIAFDYRNYTFACPDQGPANHANDRE
jgi:hypothetical protein